MTKFMALGSKWTPSRFVCVESITLTLFSGQEIPEEDGQGDDIIVKENTCYSLIYMSSTKEECLWAHGGI